MSYARDALVVLVLALFLTLLAVRLLVADRLSAAQRGLLVQQRELIAAKTEEVAAFKNLADQQQKLIFELKKQNDLLFQAASGQRL